MVTERSSTRVVDTVSLQNKNKVVHDRCSPPLNLCKTRNLLSLRSSPCNYSLAHWWSIFSFDRYAQFVHFLWYIEQANKTEPITKRREVFSLDHLPWLRQDFNLVLVMAGRRLSNWQVAADLANVNLIFLSFLLFYHKTT